MRIAFIIESSYNSGGMERMLATIANEMRRYYDVTVITAFNGDKKDFFSFDEEVKRTDLGLSRDGYQAKDIKRLYKAHLASFLMEACFDCCISLGGMDMFFLPRIKDGSKKIFWFHFAMNYDLQTCLAGGETIRNKILGRLKLWHRIIAARRFDQVVVLSKADCKMWKKYLRHVISIYNPLTIEMKKKPDYAEPRAIAVGRIERQKGFDYLVDAWKIVHERYSNWSLDIIGSSSEHNMNILQQQIDSNGLHGIITLKGGCNDMAEAYSSHSLMILSSRYEGLGLVLIEASVCGLPLIAFDCPQGPAEIIEGGRNGYLVKPVGNIQGLADAISKMISDDNLRRKMGEEAERMSARFSLDKISAQWRMLFDNLMG